MYTKRNLKFVITSQNGNFINPDMSSSKKTLDTDTMTITDCKSSVEINMASLAAGGQAQIIIYGLSAYNMAILSARGTWAFSDNRINYNIAIFANDSFVFSGLVTACFADMNNQPNASITILANGGGELKKSSAPDFSASGAIFVKDILMAICTNAKYKFVDMGVSGVVVDPHYSGNSLTQISQACIEANLLFTINNGTVTAWKAGNPSEIPEHYPVVSPESGLIGYPVFLPNGLSFKCIYSSLLTFGGSLELKTSLPNLSGLYHINGIRHFLSSWDASGDWFSWVIIVPYADTLGRIRERGN